MSFYRVHSVHKSNAGEPMAGNLLVCYNAGMAWVPLTKAVEIAAVDVKTIRNWIRCGLLKSRTQRVRAGNVNQTVVDLGEVKKLAAEPVEPGRRGRPRSH